MKKEISKQFESFIERDKIRFQYVQNIYNLFMSSHVFEGLNYKQSEYFMRKLWSVGCLASFKIKHTNEVGFTTFVPQEYDMYDWAKRVNLINPRGVPFIPSTSQQVEEDVEIMYALDSKKSISSLVDVYLEKIVNVEMVIQISLLNQKAPWLFKTTPENKRLIESYWNAILNDNPKIFLTTSDINDIDSLQSGAPYIIDKLYDYKNALLGELYTFLGISNLGVKEKKEHLVNSEVEANNEQVERSGECLTKNIRSFLERTNKLFGTNFEVKSISEIKNEEKEIENDDSQNVQ